ncbi:hypothetical protein EV360DRAFT_57920 [Lentinula raphanica]|nr:hypothetical protein EV360DRAFT_57920 [Lentinula raphanica]
MAAHKHALDDSSSTHKPKKAKVSPQGDNTQAISNLTADEIDFPRGGGTSFTLLEVKTIRAEAVKKQMNNYATTRKAKKTKRKSDAPTSSKHYTAKDEHARIEHLNYKVRSYA